MNMLETISSGKLSHVRTRHSEKFWLWYILKVQGRKSSHMVVILFNAGQSINPFLSHPFLPSFLLPSWRAVRSYRPHLEERDPIRGDDRSHSPFIRRSPSWGFLRISSVVRQMPGDLCTANKIISLSSLSLATDVTDATPGKVAFG